MTEIEHILNKRVDRLENTLLTMGDTLRQHSLRMDSMEAKIREMSHMLEMILKSQQRIEKALDITL